MLGLLIAFLGGLAIPVIWTNIPNIWVRLVLTIVTAVGAWWWGAANIYDSETPWIYLNARQIAAGMAVLGFGSYWFGVPALKSVAHTMGPVVKWSLILFLVGGLVYLLALGNQSASEATRQFTLDTMFQIGLVGFLLWALGYFLKNRPFKTKKGGGSGGSGHGQ